MLALMDIQKAVVAELERRKWTTYRLWKEVEQHVNRQSVYDFIAGKIAIRSDQLGHILEALGLEVRRKR